MDTGRKRRRRIDVTQFIVCVLAATLLDTGCDALPRDECKATRTARPHAHGAAVNDGRGLRGSDLRRVPGLRLRGGSEFMSAASIAAQNPEMASSLLSSKLVSKTRMYGLVVLGLGLMLSTLGFMFFFNRTLIGTGNLLTIAGVVLIAGHQRAYAFLAQRERTRGSCIFLFGIFLVLRGSARIGVLVEIFGILNLFGNFIPSLLNLVKSIPVAGPVLTPIIESEAVRKGVELITKYAAPSKTTDEEQEAMPPPSTPPPDLPQAASASVLSGMWSKASAFVSSSVGTSPAPASAAPPLRDPAMSAWAAEAEMPPPEDEEGAPPPYMG